MTVYHAKSAYSGYEYPDGSYSLGRIPVEKKGKREKQYDTDIRPLYETVEWSEPDNTAYLGYKDCCESRLLDDKVREYEQSLTSKLDPPSKLSQKRGRYGQNGITREARRKVKAGATLLEREYGNQRLGLCTVTLPSESSGVDVAELWYLCKNWATYQKRFLQEFKRLLARKGAPTECIAVVEFQEKRYQKYGEPAPHLHILYVCSPRRHGSEYYLSADELRQLVKRTLTNFLDRHGDEREINCNSTVNLQRIRKSASGYLSKYMSKGGQIIEQLKADGLEDCIPNQWWSPIGGMREWINANIRKISSNVASFLATAKQGDDGIECVKQIAISLESGKEMVVGIYVRVSKELFEFLSGIKWNKPLST